MSKQVNVQYSIDRDNANWIQTVDNAINGSVPIGTNTTEIRPHITPLQTACELPVSSNVFRLRAQTYRKQVPVYYNYEVRQATDIPCANVRQFYLV